MNWPARLFRAMSGAARTIRTTFSDKSCFSIIGFTDFLSCPVLRLRSALHGRSRPGVSDKRGYPPAIGFGPKKRSPQAPPLHSHDLPREAGPFQAERTIVFFFSFVKVGGRKNPGMFPIGFHILRDKAVCNRGARRTNRRAPLLRPITQALNHDPPGGQGSMNLPAASCGVSKTAGNEASFGEYDPERFNLGLFPPGDNQAAFFGSGRL